MIGAIVEHKQDIIQTLRPTLFDQGEKDMDALLKSIRDERVSNFYRMVRLVSLSDMARRKREFTKSFLRNLELMIASVKDYDDVRMELGLKLGRVDLRIADARDLPLDDESIDGIITSPPYSIALDYVANDAHALEDLGYDLLTMREKFIGVRGVGKAKIQLYDEDMKQSYREMYRVLKPGKFAVIVIGNATYQGREIQTVKFTIDFMRSIGFELIRNIDKIIFGLYNVMQRENILIFKKL